VEGPTATAAWAALFTAGGSGSGAKAGAAAKDAAAAGRSGPQMFGLQHPRVRVLLQALPGAVRLERLIAWEGGERPEVPKLVSRPLPRCGAKPRRQEALAGLRHCPAG
jgi:hypothetical protein